MKTRIRMPGLKRVLSATAVVALLTWPVAEAAPASPLGAPFRVDTDGSNGGWVRHTLARNANGGFVVAWATYDPNPAGSLGYLIYVRPYAADGTPRSAPVLVSSDASMANVSVAIDSLGNIVVSWLYSKNTKISRSGIRIQRLTADGVPLGAAIDVQGTGLLSYQAVAMGGAGDFLVSWIDYKLIWIPFPVTQYGIGFTLYYDHVHAQRYASNGTPRGNSILIHANSVPAIGPSDLQEVNAAMDTNDNFVVAWRETTYSSGFAPAIKVRAYSSSGKALSSTARVSPASLPNVDSAPAVSMAEDGSFAVAYAAEHLIGPGAVSGSDIYVQRFTATGSPMNNTAQINQSVASTAKGPAISLDAVGHSVTAWLGPSMPDVCCETSLWLQLGLSDGTPNGDNYIASNDITPDSSSELPNVASDANGNFVVAWSDSSGKLMAQRYSGQ